MILQDPRAWGGELTEHGDHALLSALDGATITFAVRVLDCKLAYGRVRVLIVPEAGTGRAWVNANRLEWYGPS